MNILHGMKNIIDVTGSFGHYVGDQGSYSIRFGARRRVWAFHMCSKSFFVNRPEKQSVFL